MAGPIRQDASHRGVLFGMPGGGNSMMGQAGPAASLPNALPPMSPGGGALGAPNLTAAMQPGGGAAPPQPQPAPVSASPVQAAVDPANDIGIDNQMPSIFDFGGPNHADPNLGHGSPAMDNLLSFFKRRPSY